MPTIPVIVMGTIVAPIYTNIFMAYLEVQLREQANTAYGIDLQNFLV